MSEARGLWVGIEVKPELIPEVHPLRSMMPKKTPHITLVHLGRHTSHDYVNRVQRALIGACVDQQCPAEITGVGYFWRSNFAVKVALINSAELFGLRAAMMKALYDSDIAYDTKFGFIPHITLSSNAQLPELAVSAKLQLPRATLVWGDERLGL